MPKKKSSRRRKPIAPQKTRRKAVQPRKKRSARRKPQTGWRRFLTWRFVLLGGLVLAVAWTIYLDIVIRVQFEGKRWALPAQVYGRPLELYAGSALSPQAFRQELEQLGYRYAYRVSEPGTFSQNGADFRLYRRAFRFWDDDAPAQLLDVRFSDSMVESVREAAAGSELDIVRLEPPRVGGIYPTHHEDRVLVKLDEVPALLPKGLVAVEDRDFYTHHGIAPRAIARAVLANLKAGATVQGGSTMTQQLVKNFFLSNKRSLWRKGNEAVMALLLEWHYDKDEILEAYLNEIYLGQEKSRAIHGFGLASHFYFDRPVQNLTLPQIATLIALVRGPSYYDPERHPERLRKRRDLILEIMAEQGVITQAQANQAKITGLGIAKGQGGDSRYPAFMDLVRRQLQRDYRQEDLTSEGLRIFTTFDPRVQQAAEQALRRRVQLLDLQRGLQGQLQGAVIVTDTTSGEVLAVVGDRQPQYAGFNRALDAQRQIGSLIKPAVYLTALEQPDKYTLATMLNDTSIRLQGPNGTIWSPDNYDGESHGTVPLYYALVHSYNQATVRLGMDLGFERIADTLHRLGAEREIPPYPSMLLGAIGFTPYEVAGLYQSLASGGFHSPLRVIREVMTAEGERLRHFPLEVQQVADPTHVAVLVSALHEVTQSGTARSLQQLLPEGLSVAGKTGTTNDLRDSWFAGFSGEHLAVVWLGLDDNQPTGLTGSSGALTVWADILANIPTRPLQPPVTDELSYHWIDRTTGLLSGANCDNTVYLAFVSGSAPTEHSACRESPSTSTMDRTVDWFKNLFKQ
jgi:penicillin-binding protein 1B